MGTKGAITVLSLLITLATLMPAPAPAQSDDIPTPSTHGQHGMGGMGDPTRTEGNNIPPTFSDKQRRSLLLANFKKSKSDAAELASLAKGLREELDRPGANELSAEVIDRVQRIEKLAKKIRDETKGY
jgi:hypothetical protein